VLTMDHTVHVPPGHLVGYTHGISHTCLDLLVAEHYRTSASARFSSYRNFGMDVWLHTKMVYLQTIIQLSTEQGQCAVTSACNTQHHTAKLPLSTQSNLQVAENKTRPLRLTVSLGGASATLCYKFDLTSTE